MTGWPPGLMCPPCNVGHHENCLETFYTEYGGRLVWCLCELPVPHPTRDPRNVLRRIEAIVDAVPGVAP